jgi:hypothetical protein
VTCSIRTSSTGAAAAGSSKSANQHISIAKSEIREIIVINPSSARIPAARQIAHDNRQWSDRHEMEMGLCPRENGERSSPRLSGAARARLRSARFALRWELRFNVKRGGKNATAHFY